LSNWHFNFFGVGQSGPKTQLFQCEQKGDGAP
jgi:hypothetical protein